ncbi:PTS system cellobiose-specific component IIB [Spiroplasma clarkii]|uniref:PTS system, cellobiose-specific IIB component n=1 Tax=Spiroplasma clarkii TaxID=2139 RepID=A0A1Y0L174_9MOLU|nr:PTS sugar transporter subunit IIB [Spiroplasma clarkii]ARU91762.1 PTS system cellobiose-specific component IIB [Spiroplasma clarkii]ATX71134.1 PTS system, cellobiose-specific IIB component [Spiroplasma clarkii]
MKLLLACAAGMSTSILVKKINDAALDEGIEIAVQAVPVTEALEIGNAWDVVLLGPQVAFKLKQFQETLNVPVAVIPSMDYARGDGEAVLEFAHEMYNDSK